MSREPQLIDISDIFKKLNTQYKVIKQFRNWLNGIHRNKLATECFQEILSICDSFIGIYDQIRDKKIKDLQWIYQQLNALNLCAHRMATKKYCEIMTDEIKQSYPGNEKALKTKEKIWTRWKTIREVLSRFCNFRHEIFSITHTFSFVTNLPY